MLKAVDAIEVKLMCGIMRPGSAVKFNRTDPMNPMARYVLALGAIFVTLLLIDRRGCRRPDRGRVDMEERAIG